MKHSTLSTTESDTMEIEIQSELAVSVSVNDPLSDS